MASPTSPERTPSGVTATSQPQSHDDLNRLHFSLKIAQKLDEKNFHLWRQQIEPYINAHGLTEFVVCSRIPLQFLNDEARASGSINPEYSRWLQKDQMLLSWLQSTLSSEILSRVLEADASTSTSTSFELRTISLENSTVQEFLLKIRNTVDALASIGDPVPASHHIDVILEGLPSDFAPVVSVIESKFGVMDLDEVEILLLAHELRLNKFKKVSTPDLVSLNLTHTTPVQTTPDASVVASTESQPPTPVQSSDSDAQQFRGGRTFRGGRSGRGRGGRLSSTVQCQVCSKPGHTALNCWHRFNQQFQPAYGASYNNQAWTASATPMAVQAAHVWTRPQAPYRTAPAVAVPGAFVAQAVPSAFIAQSAPAAPANTAWYPDSGASYHVTNDPKNLQQLVPIEGHDQILIGNGQGLS